VIGALNTTVVNWMIQSDYPLATRLEQTTALTVEAIAPRTKAESGVSPPSPDPRRES
jgi:hypothetical protein